MSNIAPETIAEIVMTLVGDIEPTGTSIEYDRAYKNLLCLEEVLNRLHDEIQCLQPNASCGEYCIKRQGKEAEKSFNSIKSIIAGWQKEREHLPVSSAKAVPSATETNSVPLRVNA